MPQSSYSRPGKHNTENSCIEMSKKSLCSLPTVALPPSWHSPSRLEEHSQCVSSISRGKKVERNMNAVVQLLEAAWGTGFCLAWHGALTRTSILWMPGSTEKGGELGEPAAPHADTRWRKRLQAPEKEQVNLSNWKIRQRRRVPTKVWGTPRISS